MTPDAVGVLGARSFVGQYVITRLLDSGCQVVACSRQSQHAHQCIPGLTWITLESPKAALGIPPVTQWISVAPLWAIPEHLPLMRRLGLQTLVALSSTSLFTKADAEDPREQRFAQRLAEAEAALSRLPNDLGIGCTLLRPTLIYGGGKDKNITQVARVIQRLGFFPLLGSASGLRQPIHADDVAQACLLALDHANAGEPAFNTYNITGGETLSYREMVSRVFAAMERTPRLVPVPLWLVRLGVHLMRHHPAHRHLSIGMAERMNRDLIFDSSEARDTLGFSARPFLPSREDVTPCKP